MTMDLSDEVLSAGVKTVSKSVLKAKMLKYFREIEQTGNPLIVTDNRKPVLYIRPIRAKRRVDDVFGDLRGNVDMSEEVVLATTEDEWTEV